MKIWFRTAVLVFITGLAVLGTREYFFYKTLESSVIGLSLLLSLATALIYAFSRSITNELRGLESRLVQSTQCYEQINAAKELIEREVLMGAEIQLNMLTLTFPSFPKRDDLGIHAILLPAREMSGDYYDFYFFHYREAASYLLESNCFCFFIGDVSGKGIPAALFMAVLRILLKSEADSHSSPAKILNSVNQIVSQDNPSCMFSTLFFGVLNLTDGSLVYSNAGHNPPYIKRKNGSLELLKERHGPALGVIENIEYRESRVILNTGDILITFTDGVTEAMDLENNFFSDQRLTDLLQSNDYYTAQEAIDLVAESVRQFQGNAEQADDLTILSIQYLGQPANSDSKLLELAIKQGAIEDLRQAWRNSS
jgi:sigma-B regulation protein RsbU (phosphoserine phosphatase)